MATQVPPKRGEAFAYEISLVSQGDTDIFQTNATLAAGDVVVYQDGALDGNADNIPTVVGAGKIITHTVSAAEMTADRVTVIYSDAVGDEWQDLIVNIHTVTTSQIDDLATAAVATEARLAELDAANIPADTNDIQSRLPAALVAGRMSSDAVAISGSTAAADAVETNIAYLDSAISDVDSDVWTYTSRTLTQSAASVASAVEGGTITITRGDTLVAEITDIGALTGYVSIDWSVKTHLTDSDDDAILRVRLNATGLDDGLLRVNGVVAPDKTKGSIVIDDEPTGDITITVDATITDDLAIDDLHYDIQVIKAAGVVTTLSIGPATIVADVTKAVT